MDIITRDDGLTDDEGKVMDALNEAALNYAKLSAGGRGEFTESVREFTEGIQHCQGALALKVWQRAFPNAAWGQADSILGGYSR